MRGTPIKKFRHPERLVRCLRVANDPLNALADSSFPYSRAHPQLWMTDQKMVRREGHPIKPPELHHDLGMIGVLAG